MGGATDSDRAVLLNDEVLAEANMPADQCEPQLLITEPQVLPLRRTPVIVSSFSSKLDSRQFTLAANWILASEFDDLPNSWSPDGSRLLFTRFEPDGDTDTWGVDMAGAKDASPVLVVDCNGFVAGEPKELLIRPEGVFGFSPSLGGQRFLCTPLNRESGNQIRVLFDWVEGLQDGSRSR